MHYTAIGNSALNKVKVKQGRLKSHIIHTRHLDYSNHTQVTIVLVFPAGSTIHWRRCANLEIDQSHPVTPLAKLLIISPHHNGRLFRPPSILWEPLACARSRLAIHTYPSPSLASLRPYPCPHFSLVIYFRVRHVHRVGQRGAVGRLVQQKSHEPCAPRSSSSHCPSRSSSYMRRRA